MKRIKACFGTSLAALVFAAVASSASADTGLVGQWHLNEGSGTVASDSSGYGDTGSVLGGAAWVPGRFGSALSFNGSTSVVQVPDNPALEPSSAVSVSAWVEHSGSPGQYRYIVAKGENGCSSASYGLYTGPNGGLSFYISNDQKNAFVASPSASTSVWDGAWHLVVGTYDGTAVRLYVDGTEVGSGTPRSGPIPYLQSDSDQLFIGHYPAAVKYAGCHAGSFLGVIDEVNIWNRALSKSQVSAMMPTTPGSGQTSPGNSGSGRQKVPPPAIGQFRVHLLDRASRSRHSRGRRFAPVVTGALISYTLNQAAHLTFTVVSSNSGIVRRGRCVKASPHRDSAHTSSCVRVVTVAQFAAAGKAGGGSLHFTPLVWRRLTHRRYRLEATPSAHGETGNTATTTFMVPG